MPKPLSLFYAPDHQGHRPQAFYNYGELQENLEKPERIEAIRVALSALPFVNVEECARHATFEELSTVHTPQLVTFLTRTLAHWDPVWPSEIVPGLFPYSFREARLPEWPVARSSYFCFDAGTPVGPGTSRAATASAGCALEAAEAVRSGSTSLAYALCRPPGHHATRARYGGFCYFNNAALVAGSLAPFGRVAVLDVDFHHGNGTQEITYRSESVMYVSIHGDPNDSFPFFYGYAEERGEGAGEGYNLNLPLQQGADLAAYLPVLQRALDAIAEAECRVLVLSAGYDTLRGDPLGGFALQPEEYEGIGKEIASLGLPTVIVQEGGYLVEQLGPCARALAIGLTG